MCLRRVAFKRNELKVTPNTTRANLYSTILGSAEFTSSTHRKRRTSLSSFFTAIIRKAFSMSATNAIGWTLNLMRMSRMSGVRVIQYGGNHLILAHFLLPMHYTQCEAWLLTCLLSRRSDGQGNVPDDKAGLSQIGQLFR